VATLNIVQRQVIFTAFLCEFEIQQENRILYLDIQTAKRMLYSKVYTIALVMKMFPLACLHVLKAGRFWRNYGAGCKTVSNQIYFLDSIAISQICKRNTQHANMLFWNDSLCIGINFMEITVNL